MIFLPSIGEIVAILQNVINACTYTSLLVVYVPYNNTSNISCNFVSISVKMLSKSCPIAMSTCLQQALPRTVTHRTQVVKQKWKLQVRFSPTKENRFSQTKISSKSDKDSFSPRCSGQDYDKKKLVLLNV